jgi:Fanconi anemia group M protein
MLKFQPRIYQQVIFNTALTNNSLVVIPTGLGKTAIALMLTIKRLDSYPKSKILILAPTKPLCEQHKTTFEENIGETLLLTGSIAPEKRKILWDNSRIIISTPQTIENDLISSRISLEDVSLIVFDEAHRATGDYSYVFISAQYQKTAKYERILALTASPGSDLEIIRDVMRNLNIEKIEVRTYDDPDVKEHTFKTEIEWIEVELPEEFKKVKIKFENCLKTRLLKLKQMKFINSLSISKKFLIGLQAELNQKFAVEKDYNFLKGISIIAETMKLQHALELLETQGMTPLKKYLDKLREQSIKTKVKAVKNLFLDPEFKAAIFLAEDLFEKGFEHPKLDKVRELAKKFESLILFTQFRSSALKIQEVLNSINVTNKIFVGQAKKEKIGLTQKEQKQIIEEFRNKEFNVLISTSVGEEGLDIPSVDAVLFYEPIPSAIRHIQRKGRTGRHKEGNVLVLVTKNTRDEIYRWSAFHKEKRMYRNLQTLKGEVTKQVKLEKFVKSGVKIIVDHREKSSGIVKNLINSGATLDLKALAVGDYLLSENVAVEFKTKQDFVDSIIDGRLLTQLSNLTKYLKPLIIIQGHEDIYSIRKIHPNAIRGMFAYITINLRIPILYSQNVNDTAELLITIAKREQESKKAEFIYHTSKPLTLEEQQEYIVSAFPGIGTTLAKPLLKEFKSIKNLVNAPVDKLMKIDLIGKKKSEALRKVFDSFYQK